MSILKSHLQHRTELTKQVSFKLVSFSNGSSLTMEQWSSKQNNLPCDCSTPIPIGIFVFLVSGSIILHLDACAGHTQEAKKRPKKETVLKPTKQKENLKVCGSSILDLNTAVCLSSLEELTRFMTDSNAHRSVQATPT